MPISNVRFRKGIFFAREFGVIEAQDAREWSQHLREFAAESSGPIAVMIDAREVLSISTTARRIFALAAETPNVALATVIIDRHNVLSTQQSRLTALLSSTRRTHDTFLFESPEEAQSFIEARLGAQSA